MYVSGRVGKGYVLGSTVLSIAVIFAIVTFLLVYSWEALSGIGWGLFRATWNPSQGQFGILSMLYGSVAVTIIALGIALPLGVTTAIFISEILPARYRLYVKSLLEVLAGIPSIIYGLIGVAFLSVWVESIFDLQTGRTILTGGLLLAIMVLPTVVTLTDDALHHVPEKYREAARGLGLYPYEVITTAVLPLAWSDILGAALLAIGRALGETMAVMLVVGSIDRIPESLVQVLVPGQTMTSKLGREIAETAFGSLHFSALIAMGSILLILVLFLTMTALFYLYRPEQRLSE